jgi:antitoxin component YwqK of YwqJK toxin-antitoxin module
MMLYLKNLRDFFYSVIPILFLLSLFSTACARKQYFYVEELPVLASINIIDRNGLSETINNPERLEQYSNVDFLSPQPYQKILRVFTRDSSGNIPASISSYHTNGTPNQYLEVVNGRACGSYKEWHPNGNLKIEAIVIEGSGDIVDDAKRTWIFDCLCQVWNENGILIAEMPYNKGSQEGVARYYYPNCAIQKIVPYQNNRIEGIFETYCSNGVLLQCSNYHRGLLEGQSHRYWDEQKLAAEENYSEGLLVSGRYYDQSGVCFAQVDEGNGIRAIFGKNTVAEQHEYHYGVLDGEVKLFDEAGRTTRCYHVKNGCKHGEEIIFYDRKRLQQMPTPKLSINWSEGNIQGVAKTWYDNGVLESQKEMSNNKRSGHNTAWYRNGTLMMIEEYDQDVLVRGEYYNIEEKFPVSIVEQGEGTCTLFDAEGNFFRKVQYWHGKPQLDQ